MNLYQALGGIALVKATTWLFTEQYQTNIPGKNFFSVTVLITELIWK